MIDYRIHIAERGALFDGRANMLMRRYADDVEKETAEYAENLVQFYLTSSIKIRTGRYQSTIAVRSRGGGLMVADDGRIPYGPWLEGVGSRNAPVTRFAGYHSFRKAGAAVQRDVGHIADRVWRRYVGSF